MELRLFGSFDVRINGQPVPLRSRKEQWLLALLTLRHDREVSRDWLATTFWPDNDESQALFYLRKALSNLRNLLGEEAVRLQSPTSRTVRLDLSGAFVDILTFDAAVARPVTEQGQEEKLLEALPLYRGPLLQDCLEEWVMLEREARVNSYLEALEAVAECARTRGDTAAASRWLRLVLATEPYRESAASALMQTLADSGDRAALQQVYKDLRLRLRADLNTTPAPETDALYKQLSARLSQPEMPSLPPPAAPAVVNTQRHLPVPLTDLLGRETEVAEVGVGLERSRLLTLLGPGGVGKTRLSIAAADAALPRFPDGVWFVDLAPLTEGAYIPEAMSRILGVSQEAGQSAEERLIAELTPRSLLLVLDNCEHLLDTCASLSHRLLLACPGLRILATSRQALGVTGEQTYSVPSLALPPWKEDNERSDQPDLLSIEKNPAFLLEYAGIELFVQRALQVNPAFRLDRQNARAVCQICIHLDGIPLAIELAAARLRSLSVNDIQARLADRFRLLTTGNRAALPRQQTLRALVDWSYSLLSVQEQSLLSRLSVFAGGWTLDAAEKVCADETLEDWEILDALTALVEKSLVVHERQGSAGRYRLLETIRQYASDRLKEAEEPLRFRRQHCDYFLARAEEMEPQLRGPEQAMAKAYWETEHDNLRQALAFCEGETREADVAHKGLRLMAALMVFWLGQDRLNEGWQHCTAILALPENAVATPVRALVLITAGNIAYCQGNNPVALQYFEESLAVRRELGDRRGSASALGSLGNVAHLQGDYVRARAFFEEALALCREFNISTWESVTLTCLGNVTFDQGDYDAARRYAEASLEICRKTGNRDITSLTLSGLGRIALKQNLHADAIRFYEQALVLDREIGKSSHEANTLCNLGIAYKALGDTAAAGAFYRQSLALINEGGDLRSAAGILEAAASFLAERGAGYPEVAYRLLGAAEKLRTDIGSPHSPSEKEVYDLAVAQVGQNLSEEKASAAWEEGSSMPLARVISYALERIEAARAL